jgi:hypothetical protein
MKIAIVAIYAAIIEPARLPVKRQRQMAPLYVVA